MILMMVIPFKRSFSEKLPHPFLTQYDGSSRVALRRCLLSLCLLHLFAGGGASFMRGGGGVRGVGEGGVCHATRTSTKAHSGSPAKAESPSKFFETENAERARHYV